MSQTWSSLFLQTHDSPAVAAVLRDTPVPAPALSPEEWQGFLDHLRPHGVYPSWRTGSGPGRRTAGRRSRLWTT